MFKKISLFIFCGVILLMISGCGTENNIKNENLVEEVKINFNDIVEDTIWTCDHYSNCIVASDGSYIKLDTKPKNNEYSDDASTVYLIEEINEKLGFSSALLEKMKSTRAVDGTQKDENDKVKVSWTYSKSNGLQVIYEVK